MAYSGNDTSPATFDTPRANTTLTSDIAVQARELDFVSRFSRNWDALREIMGIMRPIRKTSGTKLRAYTAKVNLEDGDVPEGALIPYSKAEVSDALMIDLTIKKWAKAVTIEDVSNYGAEVAIEKTDEAFLFELQDKVMTSFYAFIDNGALTAAESTFQMAVSMAVGMCRDKFKKMHRNYGNIVAFVNTLDVHRYLGSANITTQTLNGIEYLKNFLGADTVIISSEIPMGKVYATPAENIVLYYVDPSDSDFAKLGLVYTVAGDTNLIGFHVNGNYGTAVGETFALMGMVLWAEYIDGIAVIDIDDTTLTDLTVAADTASQTYPWTDKKPSDFQSDIAVANGEITGALNFMEGGLASSGPLAGDGYFLALKYSNFSSGLTYANVKVGIVPSASGMSLLPLDSDCDSVMKITDKNTQKVKVVQTDNAGHTNVQYFGLSGLTLLNS